MVILQLPSSLDGSCPDSVLDVGHSGTQLLLHGLNDRTWQMSQRSQMSTLQLCDWYSTKEPATQLKYKLPSSWITYCIISNFGIPHIEQVPHGRSKEQLRWSRRQRLPLSMRSTTSRGPDTARDFLTMVVAVSDPQHLQFHLPGLISRHAPAVAGAESVGYGWCETSEPHRQNHRQSQGPKWSNQGLVGLEWVMGSHNFPNNGSQPMK